MSLSKVDWYVEGNPVDLSDYTATTIADGGSHTLRGLVSEQQMRRHRHDFVEQARVQGYIGGICVWDGELVLDPVIDNGLAMLEAVGFMDYAQTSDGPLLYQERSTGVWADEGGSPYNGTPAGSINASVEAGALHFEVAQGQTVNQNDEHCLAVWLPGSKIRRFRGIAVVNGTTTDYIMTTYLADGPTGTRGGGGTAPSLAGGSFDTGTMSPAKDMFLIGLKRNSAVHTRTDTLSVRLRDVRINDLNLGDSLEVSAMVASIAQRAGYDTSGITTGQSNALIESQSTVVRVQPGGMPKVGEWGERGVGGRTLPPEISRDRVAARTDPIQGSALNIMPFHWREGPWAGALSYLARIMDWRWLVLPNKTLDFGPWGPGVTTFRDRGAQVDLGLGLRYHKIIVTYPTASGKPGIVTKEVAPGRRNFHFELKDVQANDTLARRVAESISDAQVRSRISGTVTLSSDLIDGTPAQLVQAGGTMSIPDWGEGQASELRITMTEFTSEEVRYGLGGGSSSLAADLALIEKRIARSPFGAVTTFTGTGRGGTTISVGS
jgi:hypothetical protein